MADFKHTRYFYPNMLAKHAEVLDYLSYVGQALKKPLAVEEGYKGRMIHYVYIS